MGNRLSFGAEGTHEAEILQSPSTKDKAKAAGGLNNTDMAVSLYSDKYQIHNTTLKCTHVFWS